MTFFFSFVSGATEPRARASVAGPLPFLGGGPWSGVATPRASVVTLSPREEAAVAGPGLESAAAIAAGTPHTRLLSSSPHLAAAKTGSGEGHQHCPSTPPLIRCCSSDHMLTHTDTVPLLPTESNRVRKRSNTYCPFQTWLRINFKRTIYNLAVELT